VSAEPALAEPKDKADKGETAPNDNTATIKALVKQVKESYGLKLGRLGYTWVNDNV